MNVNSLPLRGLTIIAMGSTALLAVPTSASATSTDSYSPTLSPRVCTGSHNLDDDGILCLSEPTAGVAVATFDSNELYVAPNAQFMLQDQAPGGATLLSKGFIVEPNSRYSASLNVAGQPPGHTWCVIVVADASDPSWWETPPTCEVL